MSLEEVQKILSPVKIKRLTAEGEKGIGLEITWSNQQIQIIENDLLRKNCPCATCLEARGNSSHHKPLTPTKKSSFLKVVDATFEESTDLKEIWLVGNYALGIRWGDKHDTGIYSFSLLATLSQSK